MAKLYCLAIAQIHISLVGMGLPFFRSSLKIWAKYSEVLLSMLTEITLLDFMNSLSSFLFFFSLLPNTKPDINSPYTIGVMIMF